MADAIGGLLQRLARFLRQGREREMEIEQLRSKPDKSSSSQDRLDTMIAVGPRAQGTAEERLATTAGALSQIDARLKSLEGAAASAERVAQELATAIHSVAALLNEGVTLQRTNDRRSLGLQAGLTALAAASELIPVIEERSRTLQYQSSLSMFAIDHQIDIVNKWYRETAAQNPAIVSNKAIAEAGSIVVETTHPIAYDSNDHVTPDSTAEGVSRPTHFVRHCIDILGPEMRMIDIGTGAAGLVYEFLMNGVVALGIDGSDYCRRNSIGYWPVVPDALHTCDVTYPFAVKRMPHNEHVKFQLITMWEVLEHIREGSLSGLLTNIADQLAPGGYYVGSVSLLEYNDPTGAPYHVTRQPKDWWREKFAEHGLTVLDDHPFNERLFCRGNGPRFQDAHNYALNPETGFHFVARHS